MQARLRAQLGDRFEYSGERRRRSVVVASLVLTITDPLRGSYPLLCNLQAALIRSCGASFACMELTIISRFQRLQTSTKSLLHPLFYSFSALSKYPPSIFPLNRFNVCLQMGWNGAILGGILGERRGVGESFAGFLAQGSILRAKGWTNELFFARKVAF